MPWHDNDKVTIESIRLKTEIKPNYMVCVNCTSNYISKTTVRWELLITQLVARCGSRLQVNLVFWFQLRCDALHIIVSTILCVTPSHSAHENRVYDRIQIVYHVVSLHCDRRRRRILSSSTSSHFLWTLELRFLFDWSHRHTIICTKRCWWKTALKTREKRTKEISLVFVCAFHSFFTHITHW